ncbi:MAG TPA: RNA polymerase sigma factor [Bryobacteraceae bacterium]|jgi:RNA polymerase sigma-70 factor (ECF subfamily)|nr:RNA polymerase sigma factor [Bryobacteraceae bacterium]
MVIPASIAAPASVAAEASQTLGEQEFLRLYELTARPLKAYLCRGLFDSAKADDVLQECYLRFILAKLPSSMAPEHQKNYLFRIATNLCCDEARRKRTVPLMDAFDKAQPGPNVNQQQDIQRFLTNLEPRQRQLLWLAYVERFSHEEIAGVVGAKSASIRSMLSRARARLSEIMKQNGFRSKEELDDATAL